MSAIDPRIAAVRRFNRFYTQRIGVLQEAWLDSPFSLAEARVLYELTRRDSQTASELARTLGLDAGYLSRMLRAFAAKGFIARKRSSRDGRQNLLALTPRGRKVFAPLESRTNHDVRAMLAALPEPMQGRLCHAMQTIEAVLEPAAGATEPYLLRPPRPGDMGWIVARHGTLYAADYGWDERIEALTAEIVAAFVRNYDPQRERCWIAERNGETVGCVMLVKDNDRTARLRLLLVDPGARGLGIGARLVDECIRFARLAGYRSITLWTHSVLTAARHVYRQAGFRLARRWKHDDFGKTLVAETWDLKLAPEAGNRRAVRRSRRAPSRAAGAHRGAA